MVGKKSLMLLLILLMVIISFSFVFGGFFSSSTIIEKESCGGYAAESSSSGTVCLAYCDSTHPCYDEGDKSYYCKEESSKCVSCGKYRADSWNVCGKSCSSNVDCIWGYSCNDGECVSGCQGYSYPKDSVSKEQIGGCYDYCMDNNYCASGFSCVDEECVKDTSINTLCASDFCGGYGQKNDCTCRTSCSDGGDCASSPQYYCNLISHTCVSSCSPYGVNNYGSCYNSCVDETYCATNYACGSDLVCLEDLDGNGVADIEETTSSATTGCSVDSDCAGGKACQESTGDCIAYCTITECNDEIDNDVDGLVDYPDDPQCRSPYDNNESSDPQCADGLDNYPDGKTDYPYDSNCESPEDDSEMAVISTAPETEGLFSKIWNFLIFWD